jgi:hypothetical protein
MVKGKETQLLGVTKEISVAIAQWFRNLTRYKTLINGFEIKSLERADQPIVFELHLDDPFYSAQGKEVRFNASSIGWEIVEVQNVQFLIIQLRTKLRFII